MRARTRAARTYTRTQREKSVKIRRFQVSLFVETDLFNAENQRALC